MFCFVFLSSTFMYFWTFYLERIVLHGIPKVWSPISQNHSGRRRNLVFKKSLPLCESPCWLGSGCEVRLLTCERGSSRERTRPQVLEVLLWCLYICFFISVYFTPFSPHGTVHFSRVHRIRGVGIRMDITGWEAGVPAVLDSSSSNCASCVGKSLEPRSRRAVGANVAKLTAIGLTSVS